MGIVSYAQNFEDVLLDRVFAGVDDGFYVDIGAHHPVIDSVTKTFYERGWTGINIEPGEIFDTLAADRPRDVNLRLAVYDRVGEIDFAQHPIGYAGLSHVQDAAAETVRPAGLPPAAAAAMQRVACDTLANILAAHAPGRPIDFLKIDVEGAELAIIRATDWRAIRPRVLVIEATRPLSSELANQEWEPLLLAQGYVRTYFDGINCFYVPAERPELRRHFTRPVNVLDDFVRHDPALAACCERLQAAEARIHTLSTEWVRMSAENSDYHERQARQRTELHSQAATIAALQDQLAPAAPPAPPELPPPPPPPPRWPLLRPLLRWLYAPVRPFIRPLARRGRGFLTGELRGDTARLEATLHVLLAQQAALLAHQATLTQNATLQAEMQAFGKMLETTLLTLALAGDGK